MPRIILDTSIYGKIIEEKLEDQFIEQSMIHKRDLIIYGMKVIRKEIKDAPKHTKDRYRLMFTLLELYDELTKGRTLEVKPLANNLAVLYYKRYKKEGGSVSWTSINNDILIVAQATLSKLDIVVANDNRTMLSEAAKSAYYTINKQNFLITPNFIGYDEFKRKLF